MPQLHMSKVAYGCRDLESLQRRNTERSAGGERRVPTRSVPVIWRALIAVPPAG